jgi:hypothetical protein
MGVRSDVPQLHCVLFPLHFLLTCTCDVCVNCKRQIMLRILLGAGLCMRWRVLIDDARFRVELLVNDDCDSAYDAGACESLHCDGA